MTFEKKYDTFTSIEVKLGTHMQAADLNLFANSEITLAR